MSSSRQQPGPGRVPVHTLLALGLLALFLLQGILALDDLAPTWDEVGHLPAGYSYLKTNDYRLYPTNPPLMKQLAALPLLAMHLNLPLDSPYWEEERHIEFGQSFLYYANATAGVGRIFFWARMVILLAGAALGWIIFCWTRKLYGPGAALFAIVLFAFNPNILAHATLVTTDIGFTLFFVAAIFAFYRFLNQPSMRRLLLLGLAFGLAMDTKFTAILLLPIFAAIFIFKWWWSDVNSFRAWLESRSARIWISRPVTSMLSALKLLLIFLLIGYGVIVADYGFNAHPLIQDGEDAAKFHALLARYGMDETSAIAGPATYLASHVPIPARTYFTALSAFMGLSPRLEKNGRQTLRGKFLMGKHRPEGFWYFTYMAFLIKTPIPLILFFLLALFTFQRREADFLAFFAGPVLILILLTLKFHDFAYRYINLPLLPFLIIFASRVVNLPIMKKWTGKLAMGVLLLWYVGSAVWIHPHYLAYFNELIGGPRNGYKYMVSSNLDWGQDLIGLKKYVQKNHIGKIKLSYNGTAVPEYYNIDYEKLLGVDASTFDKQATVDAAAASQPTTGWIAISATCLQNIKGFYPEASYDWLKKYQPIAQIGYSIFIYKIGHGELPGETSE